jgi:hypothetical protein
LVLALYAICLLAALPWLLQLHLEADVRDTLPPDMARALERHNALFGTADLAFLLVQTFPGNRDTLLDFADALHGHLTHSPLIRSVEYGYPSALLEALDRLSLDYAPLFVTPAHLDDFDRLLTPEGMRAQIHKTLLQLSVVGTGLQDQWLVTDPLQLRRFALARLSALRGTFRFDPTSPYFLSPDGTALLIKIAGWHAVHDMAGAKATVALIQQASDALRAQPAFRGLTVLTDRPWSRPRAWPLCRAALDAQRPDPRLHREPDRFWYGLCGPHPATGLQRAWARSCLD